MKAKGVTLEIVEREVIEYGAMEEFNPIHLAARDILIPQLTDAELDAEWRALQAEADARFRPVVAEEPKKPNVRAQQIEMFKSTYQDVFESDMKFEKPETKPDPKQGTIIGKITLSVDSSNAYNDFGSLLKMQNQFVKVLIGGTKVTVKDLGG